MNLKQLFSLVILYMTMLMAACPCILFVKTKRGWCKSDISVMKHDKDVSPARALYWSHPCILIGQSTNNEGPDLESRSLRGKKYKHVGRNLTEGKILSLFDFWFEASRPDNKVKDETCGDTTILWLSREKKACSFPAME